MIRYVGWTSQLPYWTCYIEGNVYCARFLAATRADSGNVGIMPMLTKLVPSHKYTQE